MIYNNGVKYKFYNCQDVMSNIKQININYKTCIEMIMN